MNYILSIISNALILLMIALKSPLKFDFDFVLMIILVIVFFFGGYLARMFERKIKRRRYNRKYGISE